MVGSRLRVRWSGTALAGTPTTAKQERRKSGCSWQSSASAFEWHRSSWELPRLPTNSVGNGALVGSRRHFFFLVGSRRQLRLSGTSLAGRSHDSQPRASGIGIWLAAVGKCVGVAPLWLGATTTASQERRKSGFGWQSSQVRLSGTALAGSSHDCQPRASEIEVASFGWQSSTSALECLRSGQELPRLPTASVGNRTLVGSRRQVRWSDTALARSSHCQPRSEIGLWLAVVGTCVGVAPLWRGTPTTANQERRKAGFGWQ